MLDISNICRICLKEEDPKLPIFTENDEKSESKPTLPEKIMSFAQVKVVKDDGLPMYICVKCYCQVDTTVEFKKLCEESFRYFKRQLDIFSNLTVISPSLQVEKENFDGYDFYSMTSDYTKCETGILSPFKDSMSFSQHHILPEDCIKVEEYEPECEAEEEPATQMFRITSCDEPWVDNNDMEFDPSVIKCETTLGCPNIEFDLSNIKIENCSDNWSDEEQVNPLELNSGDFQGAKSPYFDGLMSTPNIEKTCKCRSCKMVFSNRREMGFHISFTHRRCSTCSKYFYSNKDKDEHVCTRITQSVLDKVDQYCHLCNTTVKQIKSHMAWHRKRTKKVAGVDKETNMGKNSFVIPMQIKPEGEMTEVKIKCSLCDIVCLNEKGFKIHLKCMHADHRIIYPCFMCKSRQFFSKASCVKHLIKKHGVAPNENIQFELRHVINCDTNARGMLERKLKRSYYKSEKKINNLKTECLEKMNDNLEKKILERNKPKGKRTEINPRKCLKQTHPPFSLMSPVIRNNFNVTLDHKGVKRYVCRGCDVMYKGYVAAYNHYYTYSKRKTTSEEDELVMNSKPYSCKFCTLKFASGSQAMMHRIHAHKYFYKKYALEKK